MTRSITSLLLLLLISSMLTVSGCTSGNGTLPQDKYVAIDEHLDVTCSLINGTDPSIPHITLPVVFDYDGNTKSSNWGGRISSWGDTPDGYYPEINDSFKVLFGSSYYRDLAPRDTRTGLQVSGVYAFPYTGGSGFTIESVASNGTVYASYHNTSILLKPGDKWTAPVTCEIRSASGAWMGSPFTYVASFNTTWTVTNRGVFDKSNLTKYHNNQSNIGYYQSY